MDKTMFKGYVRQLVREAVEEELQRQIPKLIQEVLSANINERPVNETVSSVTKKPKPSREQLASMLGLERLGQDTIVASTRNMVTELPANVQPNDPNVQVAIKAINKDYSELMKKMNV